MRYYLTAGLVVLSSLNISACGKFGLPDHSQDYVKNSQEISPLVVPPNQPSIKKEVYYRVPNLPVHHTERVTSVVPPTLK